MMMMRRRLFSTTVAVAATGALCATSMAATPYSVKLKLPMTVKPQHSFKVTASGTAASTAGLTVFLSRKSCASSSKAEAAISGAQEIINKNVSHTYSTTKTLKAGSKQGTYHACGYLTGGGQTRARTSVTYYVVHGGY
jgi:hypothetical protein